MFIPKENRNVPLSELAKWPEGSDEEQEEITAEEQALLKEDEDRYQKFMAWTEETKIAPARDEWYTRMQAIIDEEDITEEDITESDSDADNSDLTKDTREETNRPERSPSRKKRDGSEILDEDTKDMQVLKEIVQNRLRFGDLTSSFEVGSITGKTVRLFNLPVCKHPNLGCSGSAFGTQRAMMQVKKLDRSKYQIFCNLRDGGYLHAQKIGCYSVSDKGKAVAARFGWI